MSWFYSPLNKGFYNDEIHTELPKDALPITEAEHTMLLEAQSAGKMIAPGKDGRPEAIDNPGPTDEELAAREAQRIDEELKAVDIASIRAIREYLTGDEDTKQAALAELTLHEQTAKDARVRLTSIKPIEEELKPPT